MKTFIGYKGIARAIPVTLLVALSTGCGIETGSEEELADLGVSEEAIGEASCAIATPSQTFEAEPGPVASSLFYISPQNYSNPNCYKAVVLDINNLEAEDGHRIHAHYYDTRPTTQTECTKLWLQMYVYAHIDGLWEKVDMGTKRGVWIASSSTCLVPSLSLYDWLRVEGTDGDNAYRVVVGARSDGTSSAPTRKFKVYDIAP